MPDTYLLSLQRRSTRICIQVPIAWFEFASSFGSKQVVRFPHSKWKFINFVKLPGLHTLILFVFFVQGPKSLFTGFLVTNIRFQSRSKENLEPTVKEAIYIKYDRSKFNKQLISNDCFSSVIILFYPFFKFSLFILVSHLLHLILKELTLILHCMLA